MFYFTTAHRYTHLVGEGLCALPQTTKTWEYNDSTWSDLLTNYNGTPITYDEIGNPLTIGEKSLTWTGRQLQSITDNENAISYTYNSDGLRTSKTVNGTKTEYFYNGSILAGQKTGDDTLVFMYDNNSDIFGFIYNDTEYYYIKNAQNDVVAIADANGTVLVKYEYDAWGKVISITDKDGNPIDDSVGNGVLDVPSNTAEPTTADETATVDESVSLTTVDPQIAQIAHLNPILYRSYYYDKETEWYYLNTRYYSPDMCRFINADGYIQTGQSLLDKNMFAYCLNNPVNYKDDNGNAPSNVQEALEAAAFLYVLSEAIKIYQMQHMPIYIHDKNDKKKANDKRKAHKDSIDVYDNRNKYSKSDNNFEVVDSYLIKDKITQQKVCQAIIDYNNENPGDYEWNRDIDTMIVEWDWHNDFALFIKNGRNVNFDMGKGTDSTETSEQMKGWADEKIRKILKFH